MTNNQGNYAIQPLTWDSQFFGFPVGHLRGANVSEIQLRALIAEAREQGWRLLYWFVEPSDEASAASAQTLRIRLTDRKARFVKKLAAGPQVMSAHVCPTEELTPRLLELARQSGHYSRFRLDPAFQAGLYERLYDHWIRRSISGQLARQTLIYQPIGEREATGLLTLDYQPTHATIGLLAVQEERRSQGIGQQLLNAALYYAHAWNLPEIHVTTQLDNEGACRFYERQGFCRVHEEHVYHVWL
ncbi:GNAT family N-acetyltransferase [Hymenobacter rubripertinctus]|nr:GNAT family N-acetyltransferase [Hymenobacter rubripertinctus]